MKDAVELLRQWPGWSNVGLEAILAHPAWRMVVRKGSSSWTLARAEGGIAETIDLDVTFDGVPSRLSLTDSPVFPDLHLLWQQRKALPKEVLLALVEKECGEVFSLLEAATQRMFSIVGLAEAPASDRRAFAVEGASEPFAFALDLPAELLPNFANLTNIDPTHPSIQEMTRDVWADYGSLAVTDEEWSGLRAGDFLLQAVDAASANWVTALPQDAVVHVMGAAPQQATFEEFRAETLPAVPEPADLVLVREGRICARVTPAAVGEAPALHVEERM